MIVRAVNAFFERNQAVLDGTMSTVQLACWTAVMSVVGYAMMAVLWVCSR